MNSGLYERAGPSATASAAAWANRLLEPATKVSKVYFGLSRLLSASRGRSRMAPSPVPVCEPACVPGSENPGPDGGTWPLVWPFPLVRGSGPASSVRAGGYSSASFSSTDTDSWAISTPSWSVNASRTAPPIWSSMTPLVIVFGVLMMARFCSTPTRRLRPRRARRCWATP